MNFTNSEKYISFINFTEEGIVKWCHAQIEQEDENFIEFRTSPYRELMRKDKSDIIEITKNKRFTEEVTWELYKGRILTEKEIERMG